MNEVVKLCDSSPRFFLVWFGWVWLFGICLGENNKVFFLLNKTNEDWWHVRKGSGKDGFVPANYVKEIEGKRIPVQVRQPFTVKDVRRVKKTRMTKKTVPIRKPKPPPKATGE